MMAIIGMFFQDGLTGSAWGDWANYTDSPLRAFESELGVQAPVGFWDPVGFTKDGDTEDFKRRRVTEIKHGRVSMLATMGYITPELTGKWPGYLSPSADLKFEGIPNGLAAISKVPTAGWVQILLWGLICEGAGGGLDAQLKGEPGNLGWKPPLLASDDAELKTKRLNVELANGRLAMMAIIGMFYQDGLTGSAWGDWALYTASPLRAFENEPGCQLPLGETGAYIWDPAGLATDQETFNKYRSAEIKHGRVAMMATIGLIAQHYGKFKALSFPDAYLDLSTTPNGFGAITTYPSSVGFACLVLAAGISEMYYTDEGKEPGDYGDPWNLQERIVADGDLKKFRSFEIEHGRLAMFGVIGTIAAELVSGYDAVDQWANTGPAFAKAAKAVTYGFAG